MTHETTPPNAASEAAPEAPANDNQKPTLQQVIALAKAGDPGGWRDKAAALGADDHMIIQAAFDAIPSAEIEAALETIKQPEPKNNVVQITPKVTPAQNLAPPAESQDAENGDGTDTPEDKKKLPKKRKAPHFPYCSDVLLANEIRKRKETAYGEIVFAEGAVHHYNLGRWLRNSESDLERWAHKLDGKRYSTGGEGTAPVLMNDGRTKGVVRRLKAMTERADFFEKAPPGITVRNGFIVFDKQGKASLVPHDRKHAARHIIDAEWKPGGDWKDTKFAAMLDRFFKDQKDKGQIIDLIGEFFGVALLGYGTKIKNPKAIFLWGPSAENGKNTLANVLMGLLPAGAKATIQPKRWGLETMTSAFAGVHVNFVSEMEATEAIPGATFKSVITGDPMMGKYMFKDPFTLRPIALNLFAMNRLPTFAGGFDNGIRRRILMIKFPHKIKVDDQIAGLDDTILREEMGAVLAFAVAGAGRLLKAGVFSEPASSTEALTDWIEATDPVPVWFSACCVVDEQADKVKWGKAYDSFKDWAELSGLDKNKLPGVGSFAQRVLEQDVKLGRAKVQGTLYVTGLKLL